MMVPGYIALLHEPDRGSEWGITFPDLPGCVSSAASFEQAQERASEALAGHIAALLADGEAPPAARSYEDLLEDEEFRADIVEGGHPGFVRLLDMPAPKERINIMIDRGVLRRIDEAARSIGVSRSAYLEIAVMFALANRGEAEALKAGGRAELGRILPMSRRF